LPVSQSHLLKENKMLETSPQSIPHVHDVEEQTMAASTLTPEEEKKIDAIAQEMRREPYWFPHDPNRLAMAVQVCKEQRITCDEAGIYHVTGTKDRRTGETPIYRIDKACCCPWLKTAKTQWCQHLIATVIYRKRYATFTNDPPMLFPQEGQETGIAA